MVGLLASPLSIAQGSGKWSPQTSVGAIWQGPPLDHTDHTRLPRVELEDIRLPGCRPHAGSRASSDLFTFVDLS